MSHGGDLSRTHQPSGGGRYWEKVIDDCGHSPLVEKPDEFRSMLLEHASSEGVELRLRGKAKAIKAIADRLIGTRGVKHGTFSATTEGKALA